MLGIFGSISDNSPYQRKIFEPNTEGFCNRLHYRITFVFLLGASILVTFLDYVGNGISISCVLEGSQAQFWTINQQVLNTYCFVLSTFTLPRHYGTKFGEENAEVGVGDFDPRKDDISYKAYYQWVPYVLFLQAMTFYLPHIIFKIWEGGKVMSIISGLNLVIMDTETRTDQERNLADYFADSLGSHTFWALKILFTEFFNLVIVISNVYFVDVFLGGEFSTYGMKVVEFLEADPEMRIDPMASIFPRVTKCSFYKFGPSGTVQLHDTICVLPINIINEKIYVFLWFWFIILGAISVMSLIYHILIMFIPALTKMFIKARTLNQPNLHLEEMGKEFDFGDWKLLYLLSRSLEPVVLGELIREIFRSIRNKTDKEEIPLMI